ncbi:MAG: tRNA sulfurtransferase [Candidatus Hydrothermarchaeota archaeon]
MKAVSLISGGIDSPVASYLMLRKGIELVYMYADNKPFVSETPLEKTKKLIGLLKKFGRGSKLYVIPHGRTQVEILRRCERKYTCVICRRFMYRCAEKIAIKENARAIVTGENLGQVASQTLSNLVVEDSAVNIPILRPLLALDKKEIINKAKEIGTYEISIIRSMCCTITPKFPATKTEIRDIEREEKRLDIEKLVQDSLKDASILNAL